MGVDQSSLKKHVFALMYSSTFMWDVHKQVTTSYTTNITAQPFRCNNQIVECYRNWQTESHGDPIVAHLATQLGP